MRSERGVRDLRVSRASSLGASDRQNQGGVLSAHLDGQNGAAGEGQKIRFDAIGKNDPVLRHQRLDDNFLVAFNSTCYQADFAGSTFEGFPNRPDQFSGVPANRFWQFLTEDFTNSSITKPIIG